MRFFLKALTHIPLPILYGIGFVAYFIAFHVMRWRRDRAEADVANAFPEKSAQRARGDPAALLPQPRRHRSWRRSGASAPAPTPSRRA